MKKLLCVLCVMALLVLPIYADGEEPIVEEVQEEVEQIEEPTEEVVEEKEANQDGQMQEEEVLTESFMAQAMDYILEHLSGVIVSVTALYAVFPKYGALAGLVAILKKLKSYFDDDKNKNSVYNVLSGNADAICQFMNDVAPILATLKDFASKVENNELTIKECMEKLESATEEKEKLVASIKALVSASLLTAEQVNNLISVTGGLSLMQVEQYTTKFCESKQTMEKSVEELESKYESKEV